jgi:hypothetical protein
LNPVLDNLELEDGRTIAAVDGVDEIKPAADGQSLTAVWQHWVVSGSKAGETLDPNLVSEVKWFFQANSAYRDLANQRRFPVRLTL